MKHNDLMDPDMPRFKLGIKRKLCADHIIISAYWMGKIAASQLFYWSLEETTSKKYPMGPGSVYPPRSQYKNKMSLKRLRGP